MTKDEVRGIAKRCVDEVVLLADKAQELAATVPPGSTVPENPRRTVRGEAMTREQRIRDLAEGARAVWRESLGPDQDGYCRGTFGQAVAGLVGAAERLADASQEFRFLLVGIEEATR